jgi:hypothetical protein
MSWNTDFLKIGPCVIAYKGDVVGVTLDSPFIKFEPEFYEAKKDSIGGKAVHKILTNMNITVSVEVKEIDNAFAVFFDESGKITNVTFGQDILTTGGALTLSPISNEDNISYSFPKAVLVPEAVYAFKNTKDHCLKMNFEVFEDSEGVLMQKL